MPYFALFATQGIDLLSKKISRFDHIPKSFILLRNEKSARGLISFIILISLFLPLSKQFFINPKKFNSYIYGNRQSFDISPKFAEKLKEITKPDDKIYIAGAESQILFYAQRESATRFIYTYPLIFATPYREKFQQEVIEQLKSHPLKAIVYSNDIYSWKFQNYEPLEFKKFLKEYISERYNLVGGYLWDKDKEIWISSIAQNNYLPSLLLYERKM